MGLIKNIFKNESDKDQKNTVAQSGAVQSDAVSVDNDVTENKNVSGNKKQTKVVASNNKKKKQDSDAFRILSAPVITEKATDLAQVGKYIFAVPVKATKSQVIEKIENVYGVSPLKVNMIYVTGKKVRRGRQWGKRNDWKKAIVTLPAGEKLEIYEGV